MESINLEKIKLRQQIRNAASSAFDSQRSVNQLFSCNQLLAQRALLAYHIDRGEFKDDSIAIEQFEQLGEQIKKALNL